MSINQNTLLLDNSAWDLILDANGNIALGGYPYSIAQDVASAVRTFLAECWYDQSQGIPYWQQILGHFPPMSFVRQKIIDVAKTVPNVASADVVFTSFTKRSLVGQIQIIDTAGNSQNIGFNG